MATEWYLMTSPHSQTSGFEKDALDDFAQEGFIELLDEVGVDVEYCNYDLSVCTPIRAILQKRVQDTKLQAFTRELLVPIGTCKAGNYIKFKDRYWLLVSLVDDNGMYEKAILHLCNWKLTWLNDDGVPVERWAYVQSASQYNNGQRETKTYVLRTDQLMIDMPFDDECLLLDEGKRFIIDKRVEIYSKSFDDSTELPYTDCKLIIYQCTRNDSVLYNYIDSGHYQILVTQDEQHDNDGYYMIDGKGYWICPDRKHVITINESESDNSVDKSESIDITYDTNNVYVGLDAAEFTAVFYDNDGNIIDGVADWNINCDFMDKLQIDCINNTIYISTDDYSLVNKSFELSLTSNDSPIIKVYIVGLV